MKTVKWHLSKHDLTAATVAFTKLDLSTAKLVFEELLGPS